MNAGNKKDVDEAAKREINSRHRELADVRHVMSTPAGRRFVNRIIQNADPMGEVFSPNGSITNLNLGRRKVGLFVFSELEESCPELYLLMRQEYVRGE